MNEQTRIIYRILEERYVKIAWTHKIQECQSEIHLEEFIKQRNQMGLAAALTSSTAIISLIAKCASFIDNKYILLLIPIITAGLSAWSTYLTFRFKDRVLEKKLRRTNILLQNAMTYVTDMSLYLVTSKAELLQILLRCAS